MTEKIWRGTMIKTYEEDLRSKVAHEINLVENSGGRINFALVYPNFYRVGMSNLGIHIIYQLLNTHKEISCQRFFLDSILSLETQTPLNKFQIIGFAVSFEPDYFNIIKILQHLVKLTRQRAGLSEEPTQALIDSQSVKTTGAVEQKGFDAGKKRKE